LLADAGHNLSDVLGLVLAWGGALAGRLRPDARHTYGWKRASILAAFLNALLLVAMGSLALEAVERLGTPAPVSGLTIMAVAGVGIAVNTFTALLIMRGAPCARFPVSAMCLTFTSGQSALRRMR
jgi:cobalt-zinc-cadmium efflux system protein